MRTLLRFDKMDYDKDMRVCEKYSTRAIIMKDGKIATQHGGAGEYKLLGGGVEKGESYIEALCREVREEAGLIVIPESVKEIGEIEEKRKDIFDPDVIYVCHSYFYLCDITEERREPIMTESEIAKGYHLCWATPEEIISGNAPHCETMPWIMRDTEFVQRLQEFCGFSAPDVRKES